MKWGVKLSEIPRCVFMRKTKSLPDSLELLLDTMCNTFGGIMFIAISLIILSQVAVSYRKKESPHEIQKQVFFECMKKNNQLRQAICLLEKKVMDQEALLNGSPEKKEVFLLYRRKKSELIENTRILDSLDSQNKAEKIRLNRRTAAAEETKRKLQSEILQNEKILSEKIKKIETLENEIRILAEQLENWKPKTLRFAKEEETALSPYWVLLKENRLYRFGIQTDPLKGEVYARDSLDGRRVKLIPERGSDIKGNDVEMLEYLFKPVRKDRHFVSLVSDKKSHSALLVVRQFLREKGIQVDWKINPDFEFYYSTSVRNKASY